MNDDSRHLVTNLSIIGSIIFESQKLMNSSLEEGRTPREDEGFILRYDPNYTSFKEALKVLVFIGAALESMWHQKAVELKSKAFAEKTDRRCKLVSKKYECLGVTEKPLRLITAHFLEQLITAACKQCRINATSDKGESLIKQFFSKFRIEHQCANRNVSGL